MLSLSGPTYDGFLIKTAWAARNRAKQTSCSEDEDEDSGGRGPYAEVHRSIVESTAYNGEHESQFDAHIWKIARGRNCNIFVSAHLHTSALQGPELNTTSRHEASSVFAVWQHRTPMPFYLLTNNVAAQLNRSPASDSIFEPHDSHFTPQTSRYTASDSRRRLPDTIR